MRSLRWFLVASFLALIWLGLFAIWGMINFSKDMEHLHELTRPAWFQSFNVWASAFAWLFVACSVTARTYRIVRVSFGKADEAERKATLHRVRRKGNLVRAFEALILPIAGPLGVLILLFLICYAFQNHWGEPLDQLAKLTAPFVKPLIGASVLCFTGASIWLYRQESILLRDFPRKTP